MAHTFQPPSTTPADVSTPQGLRNHIRTVFADWPRLAHELLHNFDAELQNEVAARHALEIQSREQVQMIANQQLQLSQVPDITTKSKHPYQPRQTFKNPKPFKAETVSALTRKDEYCAWKQDLQFCWAIDSTALDTERKKLFHMVSLLKGKARQKQRKDIDDIIQDKSAYTTTELFFEKLDSFHISVESEREAALQFDKLKMQGKQGFLAFYAQLEYLGNACYKSPQGMVLAMKQKVTEELRLMFLRDGNPCANDDLDGWKRKFQVWYQNCREYEYYNGAPTKVIYPRPFVASTSTQPTPNDSTKLDTFRTQNRKQQRQRELRLGLCHYCKKSGHSVWECEAKKAG
ncbi:uncharacterized protein EAF01_005749 [Botrytis porri]|uniref:uncharacterized protein n=1 Tax=Botrytis porri TaxID=87229 RepID=UPI00190165A7|nr:uncharacterized protein EAF01_005749 [Botrytis porri]KAF7905228.1 hypothetical protein EAF01_005749 [Botrytis porri]